MRTRCLSCGSAVNDHRKRPSHDHFFVPLGGLVQIVAPGDQKFANDTPVSPSQSNIYMSQRELVAIFGSVGVRS